MYYTTLPDTLIVDGTDLQSLDGVGIESLDCLLAPGLRRGTNDVIPGRRGQLGTEKVYDAYPFSLLVAVFPVDSSNVEPGTLQARRALMLTNYRALLDALTGSNGLVALTRRLSTATTYTTDTAAGEFVGAGNFHTDDDMNATVELQFLNLDGAWWSGSSWLVP